MTRELYCLKHKETFGVDTFPYLDELRELAFPQVLGKIQRRIEEEAKWETDVQWLVERMFTLISTFVERHQDCVLKIADEDNLKDESILERILQLDLEWRMFGVLDDGPFMEVNDRVTIKDFISNLKNAQARVRDIKTELAKDKINLLRKRRLRKKLDAWKGHPSYWREMIQRMEGNVKKRQETGGYQRNLEELLKTLPLRDID